MRFARADRAGKNDDRRRPGRPLVDDRNGRSKAFGYEEVVTPPRRIMGELQQQLLGLATLASLGHSFFLTF
jgi:hypothetical protein